MTTLSSFDSKSFQNGVGDNYVIGREIGRGGMAIVFAATDRKHNRPVAIKVLDAEAASGAATERFQQEIRVLARLQHPNLVPVFDSGVANGQLWYAMPLVEGESLRARLQREGALGVETSRAILQQLAGALDYAHSAGVIHRDIKPDNILLSHSIPMIADFGIAAALHPAPGTRLTAAGIALGTIEYMSPEQATGDNVDARSDIYSLGCVAFEMLVGKPPFTAGSIQAIAVRILSSPTPSIRAARPEVPRALDAAIARAIARDPGERWQKGSDLAAALAGERAFVGSPWRSLRPRSRAVAGAAGIALFAAAAFFYSFSNRGRAQADVTPSEPVVRDSAAFAAYTQGMARVAQRTQRTLNEGLGLIDRAISLDSGFALAWAGRAYALNWAREWEFQAPGVPRDSLLSQALAASERALDLDSTDATVWYTSAIVARAIDPTRRQIPMSALRRALALDSLNPRTWQALGLDYQDVGHMDSATQFLRRAAILSRGRVGAPGYANHFYWRRQYDSAAAWSDSAIRYSPRLPYAWEMAGATALMQKRYDDAESYYQAATRLDEGPTRIRGLEGLAEVAAARGDSGRARGFLRDAEKLANPSDPNDHAAIALASAYAALGEHDLALQWLERFQTKGDLHFQLHLKRDPQLDPLRNERRFISLLR